MSILVPSFHLIIDNNLADNEKRIEERYRKEAKFCDINDVNDLYNSSQIYCKNLEKQVISMPFLYC